MRQHQHLICTLRREVFQPNSRILTQWDFKSKLKFKAHERGFNLILGFSLNETYKCDIIVVSIKYSFNLILGFSLNETQHDAIDHHQLDLCFNLILGFSLNETLDYKYHIDKLIKFQPNSRILTQWDNGGF